jgi:hypothetical protein
MPGRTAGRLHEDPRGDLRVVGKRRPLDQLEQLPEAGVLLERRLGQRGLGLELEDPRLERVTIGLVGGEVGDVAVRVLERP